MNVSNKDFSYRCTHLQEPASFLLKHHNMLQSRTREKKRRKESHVTVPIPSREVCSSITVCTCSCVTGTWMHACLHVAENNGGQDD